MNLLGKATDKVFWQDVREKACFASYREVLLNMWQAHCHDQKICVQSYSDFKLYWTTGDRAAFEKLFFQRRSAIGCAAVLSLIYPEEEKYLTYLQNLLFAVCNEFSWCLPAHLGKMEASHHCVIDLFASETGFMMAEVYTMLEDRLDPFIKDRIKLEVDRRILTPYSEQNPYSWWEHGVNNWTAVCTGSVACTVMLLYPEKVEELILRWERSVAGYLNHFKDDGVCDEGCAYWQYGFSFYVMYADMLRRFTDGRIDGFKDQKVKSIATFLQKMYLSGNASVSFSDCSRSFVCHVGLLHYLKKEYLDDVLVYDAAFSDWGTSKFSYLIRCATWFEEAYYNHPDPDNLSNEFYAANYEWFIKKTEHYGFAAKGGSNAEQHNQNDVGSFIFAKNGRQVLMDLGRGVYTRQYFDGKLRWGILECSSRGHSVPMIGDTVQAVGGAARAVDTKLENGVFSMEIGSAYPCQGLRAIHRAFSFTNETVTLCDRFEYDGCETITDRIVTLLTPEIVAPGTVQVEDVIITYDATVCDCVINSEQREMGDICYMIDFVLKDGVRAFTCTMR